MISTKLTDPKVAALRAPDPSGKPKIHWDSEVKGLGVLCSGVSDSRAYVFQGRLADGRTRRITLGPTSMGIIRARAEATERAIEVGKGRDPKFERKKAAQQNKTLRDALKDYLDNNKSIRESTRQGYAKQVEMYLKGWLGDPIRELTQTAVRKRHTAIAEEVAARARARVRKTGRGDRAGGGPTTGHATADGVMRALRAIWYHEAELDTSMPPCPVKMKKGWFKVAARTHTVARPDLPKFFAAVDALPNRVAADYIKLLMHTGLRRSEAAALRWDEVNFDEDKISLPAKRLKTKRQLDLPMTTFVRELLEARRKIGKTEFVFPGNGKSRHIQEPKFALAEVAAKCGVRVSPHALRHLYVTVANGCPIPRGHSMALVNHSVGGNVHDDYDDVTVDELRGSAQVVCDRLVELCAVPV